MRIENEGLQRIFRFGIGILFLISWGVRVLNPEGGPQKMKEKEVCFLY